MEDEVRTVIPGGIGLVRNLAAGNYEYYIKDSAEIASELIIPFSVNMDEPVGINIKISHVSAFGKADGSIMGHIRGGVSPYRIELTVNGNPYRTIEDIPAQIEPEDDNCDIQGLPPGAYTIWVYDKNNKKAGGNINYNVQSPPFATLNGSIDPLGLATTVSFQYGIDNSYGNEAQYGVVNGTGERNVSLQLDASNLQAGTTYHYRMKAVNVTGTSYSTEDVTFTTSSVIPILHTLPATNII